MNKYDEAAKEAIQMTQPDDSATIDEIKHALDYTSDGQKIAAIRRLMDKREIEGQIELAKKLIAQGHSDHYLFGCIPAVVVNNQIAELKQQLKRLETE